MAYVRLFRRVRIAPGVSLNLAKHGPSLSLGVRGAHLTVARSGIRRTVGIPGTGIFATSQEGWHTGMPFHEAAGRLTGWRRVAHDVILAVALAIAGIVIAGIIAGLTGH
ncbi:MAG TPA: DUF4236 domain-containing protein [Terriglobia bacterium]|nr:DUF4236 domain-containing protein [Terriglobia bacterium]